MSVENKKNTRNMKIEIGRCFGKLKVKEDLGIINKSHLYKCECECGAIVNVRKGALVSGRTDRCASCSRRIDYKGKIINGYCVEELIGKKENRTNYLWRCRCINCGAVKEVESSALGKQKIAKCKCRRHIKPLRKTYIGQIF